MTRYGKVSISKTHRYMGITDGYGISPRWREVLIFLGQEACYGQGSQELELLFGLPVSAAQIHRLTNDYGERIAPLLQQEVDNEQVEADEVIYAEVDGSMLFTRESGWQEVKVGRTFRASDCLTASKQRGMITRSDYAAHLGKHTDFEEKMAVLVDPYEALAQGLVFLTDGAPWIANWVKAAYPRATMILDVFHAKEHLSAFLQVYYGKQEHQPRFKQWSAYLLNEGGQAVIKRIQSLPQGSKAQREAQKKLLGYFTTNAYRMHYPTYRKNGLQIGSGAIEAAHRTVVQSRLKRSGQRWSCQGAQNVLNLRVLNMSGRWHQLQNLLKAA